MAKIAIIRPGNDLQERFILDPYREKHPVMKMLNKSLFWGSTVAVGSIMSITPLVVCNIFKNNGFDVEFIDVSLEFGMPLRDKTRSIREEKIREKFLKENYDIVGISCNAAMEYLPTKYHACVIKDTLPNAKLLVGGYHATEDAIEMMNDIPQIDIIVRGDLEPISQQLVEALLKDKNLQDIPNLIYREKDKIMETKREFFPVNLNDGPIIDYSFISRYLDGYAILGVESSRGCFYKCNFCMEKSMRLKYLRKSAERVVHEIEKMIEITTTLPQFGEIVPFYFSDAFFGANLNWLRQFCELLIEKQSYFKKPIMWLCESVIGHFDGETLKKMFEAGCRSIFYGVESFNPKILKNMNKSKKIYKGYRKMVVNSVRNTIAAGIRPDIGLVIGFPGETLLDYIPTIIGILQITTLKGFGQIHINFATPYPNTTLTKFLMNQDNKNKYGLKLWIDDIRWWTTGYIPEVPMFNPSKFLTAPMIANIFNFLQKIVLKKIARTQRNISEKRRLVNPTKDIMTKEAFTSEEIVLTGKLVRELIITARDFNDGWEILIPTHYAESVRKGKVD